MLIHRRTSTSDAAQPVTALGLRTCAADMTSYGGFRWPEAGEVIAPDWTPEPVCGGGLHLLPWGRGEYGLLSSAADARWLVAEYDPTEAVDLGGKVKVPRATVVYCGTAAGALAILRGAQWGLEQGAPVEGVASTTGDYAHASTTGEAAHASTTGWYAHAATTGWSAHAAATGMSAHAATTGEAAHASTTGDYAHASTTGEAAHATTTGWYAHAATTGISAHAATTGDYAHAATTGEAAHAATTGDYAHAATTGDYAHAAATGVAAHASTTGVSAIAAALGDRGRVKATHGPLVASYRDTEDRLRVAVAYPGEGGIEPDVWYRVDEHGQFVRDLDMSPQE